MFVAINTVSEKYELIRPAVRIKRVMLEKMLDGAANDIKNATSETIGHSENALWLMKLVHDFLFSETGNDNDAWSDKVWSIQSSGNFIGRRRATLVFYARVKSCAAFAKAFVTG